MAREKLSPVVSTGAPKVRSGETLLSANSRQIVERRSLRFASLRSAPVETTELCRCASYFFSMFQKTGTRRDDAAGYVLPDRHGVVVLAEEGVRGNLGGAKLKLLDDLLALGLVGLVGEGIAQAS